MAEKEWLTQVPGFAMRSRPIHTPTKSQAPALEAFQFQSIAYIPKRGYVHYVKAIREMPRDDTGLVGNHVLINGVEMLVKAVERKLPNRPIQPGETIGLLAVPTSPSQT